MTTSEDHTRIEKWRHRCRVGISVFYGLAGGLHLAFPGPFLAITPDWVPDPSAVIALTGICELVGAVGLWFPRLRRYAGFALALYAICVFPANIKHAFDSLRADHPSALQWVYHIVRLPLQPVIVWLAIFAGGVVSWPFRSRASPESWNSK